MLVAEATYIPVSELEKNLAKLVALEGELIQWSELETKLVRLADQKLIELVSALAISNREDPGSIYTISLKFQEISDLTKPEFSIYIRFSEKTKNKLDNIEMIVADLRQILPELQEI